MIDFGLFYIKLYINLYNQTKQTIMNVLLPVILALHPTVWLSGSSVFKQEHAMYNFLPLGVTDSYLYNILTPAWMTAMSRGQVYYMR